MPNFKEKSSHKYFTTCNITVGTLQLDLCGRLKTDDQDMHCANIVWPNRIQLHSIFTANYHVLACILSPEVKEVIDFSNC